MDGKICYHSKNALYLKTLFQARYILFKQVYFHRVVQAVDLMYVDALMEVNSYYKFADNLRNPQEYYKYTDSLVKCIESVDKVEFKKA